MQNIDRIIIYYLAVVIPQVEIMLNIKIAIIGQNIIRTTHT